MNGTSSSVGLLLGVVGFALSGTVSIEAQDPRRVTAADVDEAFDRALRADVIAAEARLVFEDMRRSERPEETDIAFGNAGPFRIIASRSRLADAVEAVALGWADFAPYVARPEAMFPETTILLAWSSDPRIEAAREVWTISVRRRPGRADAVPAVRRAFAEEMGRHLGHIQRGLVYFE